MFEFNLHQEHLIQDSNISLDGDKVHAPGYHPYQFQDSRWCDPRSCDPNFWEYQPRIADNNSWQLWYQGQSTPIQQQGRTQVQCQRMRPVQPRTTESIPPHPPPPGEDIPLPEISEEGDKNPKKYPQSPEGAGEGGNNSQIELNSYGKLRNGDIIFDGTQRRDVPQSAEALHTNNIVNEWSQKIPFQLTSTQTGI